MIRELPSVAIEGHEASTNADETHPMRIMTRRAAGLDGPPWDDEARATVAALFDSLAGEWHTRVSPAREAVVDDVLARGTDGLPSGLCVEVGSGIGSYTPRLAARWGDVLAVDLSTEMLRLAPASPGWRVRADASRLPVRDGVAAAVVLINAFLFPGEVARVLRPDGAVVWVNSSGERTPIHLPADDVVAALPGEWEGVRARAGIATWCVLRRPVPSSG